MSWSISQKRRNAIYLRDGYVCGYCGRSYKSQPSRLTLDHVKPRAQGGSNQPSNLVTCCDRCNMQKGNKTVAQYETWWRLNITWRKDFNAVRSRLKKFRRRKLAYVD